MKTTRYVLFVICLFLILAANVHAALLNGGFESGDLSGWDVAIEGAVYQVDDSGATDDVNNLPFSLFDGAPLGCPSCGILPAVWSSNHYSAAQGTMYLEIPGNIGSEYPFVFDGDVYIADLANSTISVSTELFLNTGDTISGWMALFTTDYPPYNSDRAFIEVRNSTSSEVPLQITVQDAWGPDWSLPDAFGDHASPWTYWSWTAPDSGYYTLSLNNYMDDQEASIASFDGIAVVHSIPEPLTATLLMISMGGVIGLDRVQRSKKRDT